MNIILLSGGSGKRLWPLSNEVRSKQFIKLFKKKNGEYESMVQRVYRQITAVDSNAKVTIATSKSQVSAIRNQLGDKVSICVEPCRMNTFPAVALAAAYLHDKLEVSLDEPVVVCPVDPFVDNSYYEAFDKLEQLVKSGTASLTLMGIEPTYPSEKYGYIIPKNTNDTSGVEAFKEKPDIETAKQYISKGALWNAGIFAAKLNYLLNKAHNIIDFIDYNDLYSKYESALRTSFDYAVVEKEANIQVLRYSGEWKDVGTWNTLTEVMSDIKKGNVIMDEACHNTKVINELEIPVLCIGCENMVIAVSGEGVLVSDKERSDSMKPFVEKLPSDVRFAEKSWGTYTVIDTQPGSMTIKLHLQKGNRLKYHDHNFRDESWSLLSGSGRTIIDGVEQYVRAGDIVTLAARSKHTIIADTDMDIIEVQIGSSVSKEDKVTYPLENQK